MADNPVERKQNNRNIPGGRSIPFYLTVFFLVFQLILLLIGIFKLKWEIAETFTKLLEDSSDFWGIVNLLLLIGYWVRWGISKKKRISKETPIANTCICIGNIVLVKRLYSNGELTKFWEGVKAFFTEHGTVCIVVLFIAGIIFAAIVAVKKSNKTPPLNESQSDMSADTANVNQPSDFTGNGTVTNDRQAKKTSANVRSVPPNRNNRKSLVTPIIELSIPLGIGFFLVYILIDKYEVVVNLIKEINNDPDIRTFAFLILAIIALTLLSPIFILKEYIQQDNDNGNAIIKLLVASGITPFFYVITNLFGITTKTVQDMQQDPTLLATLVVLISSLAFSWIFVNTVSRLFLPRDRKGSKDGEKQSNKRNGTEPLNFEPTINYAIKSIVAFVDSIIHDFFRTLKLPPDFLSSIETVLFGEEDEPM